LVVDRLADHAEQARAGVDRDRAPGVDRGRETIIASAVLPVPKPPVSQRPRPASRFAFDLAHEGAQLADLRREAALHVDHVAVLEGDRAVARRDPRLERACPRLRDPRRRQRQSRAVSVARRARSRCRRRAELAALRRDGCGS
jgi:hypothetical protein